MTELKRIYIEASPLTEKTVSGIPHFTHELVKALSYHPDNGKKFEVILITTFDKKKNIKLLGNLNVRYQFLPIPMRLFNLAWKLNILPPLDIFLGKGIYLFPNFRNWPLYNSKSITYIHDLGFIRFPGYVQPKNLAFLQKNVNRWISRTDIIVTPSLHARTEAIKLLHVQPKKVVKVYHGIDLDIYHKRSKDEINKIKTLYDIKGEYLLYLGSLEPRKNLIRLIESYRQLPGDIISSYQLILVGGQGWLNQEIMDQIEKAQKDGFNVYQIKKYVNDEDLPALISGATALVHPAIYEGFGLSTLQAMACGTPVLTSNNSSLPEVVGKAAIRVDADDINDITLKLSKLLTSPELRKKLKEEGLIQARKFSWDDTVNTILFLALKRLQ